VSLPWLSLGELVRGRAGRRTSGNRNASATLAGAMGANPLPEPCSGSALCGLALPASAEGLGAVVSSEPRLPTWALPWRHRPCCHRVIPRHAVPVQGL